MANDNGRRARHLHRATERATAAAKKSGARYGRDVAKLTRAHVEAIVALVAAGIGEDGVIPSGSRAYVESVVSSLIAADVSSAMLAGILAYSARDGVGARAIQNISGALRELSRVWHEAAADENIKDGMVFGMHIIGGWMSAEERDNIVRFSGGDPRDVDPEDVIHVRTSFQPPGHPPPFTDGDATTSREG